MPADKKPTMSRQDAQAHLKAGHVLAVGSNVYRRNDKLPPPPDGEHDTPLEAIVVRDVNGNLTHAGMVWTIQSGGSVMYRGEIIDNLDALPDEAELARHDEVAKESLAKSYDDQIAQLQQQKAKLAQQAAEPEHAPARTHGPTAETTAASEEDEEKSPASRHAARQQPKRG